MIDVVTRDLVFVVAALAVVFATFFAVGRHL